MAASTSPVKFVVISDNHGRSIDLSEEPCDVVLHCGDLTMDGRYEEFERTIKMLKTSTAELKLVIAGNHDISLDDKYYARQGPAMHGTDFHPALPTRVRKLWESAAPEIHYLDEGLHTFTLSSGAMFTIYASPFQPEFCDWAFQYPRDHDRFNLSKYATKHSTSVAVKPIARFPSVDIVMVHGPPLGHLDQTANGSFNGCRHLQRAVARAKPQLCCFGHIHEGYGAERIVWNSTISDWDTDSNVASTVPVDHSTIDISQTAKQPLRIGHETLMVNASILDGGYAIANEPMRITLQLLHS